jgi:hypothetical protein
MPTFPIYNVTDKSSTVAATAGAALSAEYAMQAYPFSHNKRKEIMLRPLAATAGATAAEAFIDGIAAFRLQLAANSTVLVKAIATYNCSVAGSNTIFEINAGFYNVAGTVTALANSTTVKMPNASTATLAITISGANLVFTCTGIAGDANGQWSIKVFLDEVTDLG